MTAYIPYNPSVEIRQPDEDQLIEAVTVAMHKTGLANSDQYRHGVRDAHVKSHGILKAQVIVEANLPEYLAQGAFAQPVTYDAIIRLSTGASKIKADADRDVYGFALKILGVHGERAIAADTSHNQDFLMVNNPIIPFGDAQAYATFLKLVGTVTSDVSSAKDKLHEIVDLIKNKQTPLVHKVISALAQANTHHILGETFFSMAAMRYGNYMAKISVAPLSPEVSALTGTQVANIDQFSSIRDAVVEFFQHNSAQYQLCAQLCANLDTMPIEDASILWSEDESAHQPIARIIIPQQEAYSPARRVFGDDVLSYSPWNALAAHQPLGSLMRMRQKVYESSSVLRHDLNRQPRIEPTSITELPN